MALRTDAVVDHMTASPIPYAPPKWHIAHVTRFFKTFLLKPHHPDYRAGFPGFEVLFNSCYESIGKFHPRQQRSHRARPSVEEVYRYRHTVEAIRPLRWVEQAEGLHEIGHAPGSGVAFDNESPRHCVWLNGLPRRQPAGDQRRVPRRCTGSGMTRATSACTC